MATSSDPRPKTFLPADSESDFQKLLDVAVTNEEDRDHNFLRLYDIAIVNWIKQVVQIAGKPIPVVVASPMNAFADINTVYNLNSDHAYEHPQNYGPYERIPIPSLTITSSPPEWRASWGNNRMRLRNLEFVEDTGNRQRGHSRYPRPVDIKYQIDILTRYKAHASWIITKVEAQFENNLVMIPCKTAYSDDTSWKVSLFHEGWTDNSDLESGQDPERIFRHTLSLKLEGLQFHDIYKGPTVLAITQDSLDEVRHTKLTPEAPDSLEDQEAIPTTSPL